MKYFLLAFAVFATINGLFAQSYPYPALDKGEPTAALHGIASQMQYRTEIRAKVKQTELIKKIKGFLAEVKLLDTVKNKTNKITDKLSSFTIPLQYRSGFVAGKGKSFISKRLRHPVLVNFDAEFKFSDSIVTITFSHFSETVFYEIKSYDEGNYAPELGEDFRVEEAKRQNLEKLKNDVMQGATLFGKLMTAYDAGGTTGSIRLSGKGISVESDKAVKNKFAELNKTLEEQYAIIDQAVADNLGKWLTGPQPLDYFNKLQPKFKKFEEMAKTRIAEGYLLVVDNDRFDNYFEKIVFNEALLNIANLIGGEIKEIKKDNDVKYLFVDGQLKLQKSSK